MNARSASATAGNTISSRMRELFAAPLRGVIHGPGGAQDVGDGDAPALARQLVAAARTADAVEDSFVHQRLQHRLEMARREIVSRRELARRHRPFARIERDIDDRSDGKQTLAGQKRHGGKTGSVP